MKNECEFKAQLLELVWRQGAKAFVAINSDNSERLISEDEKGQLIAVENHDDEDVCEGFCLCVDINEDVEVKGILPAEFGRLGEEQDLAECVRYEEIMLIVSGRIMAEACQQLLDWIESGDAWLAYIEYIKTKDEDE